AMTLVDVVRTMDIVRLGQGVDATGELSAGALARTFAKCDEYAATIAELGAGSVRFVATSATRDAKNRMTFVDGVRDRLGIEPEVIPGDTEARLSFLGATRSLVAVPSLARRLIDEPSLVLDIGGGSTEFVLGTARNGVEAARSMNIGCVRITERRLHSDPPTAAEIVAATADIDAAIEQASETVDLRSAKTLVGLAGSVTTLAAIALDLDHYDPLMTHGSMLMASEVHELAERLLGMPRQDRAAIAVMHPGRVDVIGAGALILDRVVTATGLSEVLVSEHDILDGIAWSLADG
ncbi:MAG: exopolyphosphatase, partial [Actinomycetes bacterium]